MTITVVVQGLNIFLSILRVSTVEGSEFSPSTFLGMFCQNPPDSRKSDLN